MREPKKFYLLGTPLFVASICVLALNDFILKPSFHNWITGKLSDFAGLTAFTLFLYAIWPSRRWLLATTISATFLFWKTPYSQPAIDHLNRVLPFHVGRTPDYSDCVALPSVWIVCLFVSRLRPWPVRRSLKVAMAALSLFLFTATSYMPMHKTMTTAFIPTSANQIAVEKQVQELFDNVASQHGLRCSVCDSLSNGRLYVRDEADPRGFSLVANFDARLATLFFSVSSEGPDASKNASEIDLLRTEIVDQLHKFFPDVKIAEGKRPKGTTLQLGVSKYNSSTSYQAAENQDDFEKAVHVVEAVVTQHGLKRSTPYRNYVVFFTGRLFGPLSSDHELVVSVGIADWPLVPINVTAYSSQYYGLQRQVVDELELKLQAAFGKERAWVRWGSRK
jgi:hypothetical protein